MSTPIELVGQSFTQGINVLVSGLKSFDNFGRSTLNTFNRGVPSPQQAMNQVLSLPQSILPKGGSPLALPNLGQVNNDLQKNLNVSLPNLRSFGNLIPSIGGIAEDATVFGASSTRRGLRTNDSNRTSATGVSKF